MKLIELFESKTRLDETTEDDKMLHRVVTAVQKSIRAMPEWLEYFHPDGTRVNYVMDDGEVYDFEADKYDSKRYYNLYIPETLTRNYGTIGEITGLKSETPLGKYILGVKICVETGNGLESEGYFGLWYSKSKTIVIHTQSLFQGSTLNHELRHAIDDFYSNGKNYPESQHKLKWADRPAELSAEYATAAHWLRQSIEKSVNIGKPINNAELRKMIDNSMYAIKILKLKDKSSPEYKRFFSRLYQYAMSLKDENYSPKDRFSVSG
jgi:hypothetical protein